MGLKQTSLWRSLRGVKRKLLPPRHDSALPSDQCRGRLLVIDPPVALEAGRQHTWTVTIENRGGSAWGSEGPRPVRLRVAWETYHGQSFGEPASFPLPSPAYPGEPLTFAVTIPNPGFVGDFVAKFDLTQEPDGPFAQRGDLWQAAEVALPVLGQRAQDIDYHQVYRDANLDQNHWWVVGHYPTKEQYERSSKERLGMLVQHGLTPNSRVIDIGCGTGQMASVMEGYLTDAGAYYGTDIGKEAIAFCQEHFRRRNFVFRRGEMTRVPFSAADGQFDIAIFFSVFTHTFVDETALLLAEAKRMLGPKGRIIADVIVSDLIERGAGNRGEMIVNREHFLRMVDMLGMSADVIGRWPWNPQAERLMYVIQRTSASTPAG